MSKPEPNPRKVRVLLLEDSDIDTELLITHLTSASEHEFVFNRVIDRRSFVRALAEQPPDLILADYSLPDFDGLSALSIAHELTTETPFIFVSGVVGEEFATNALKRGAVDYVMKRNLRRLPTAVERALAAAREKADRRRAEAALQASQISVGLAVEAAGLGLWDYDPRSGDLTWDEGARRLFGAPDRERADFQCFINQLHPDDKGRVADAFLAATKPGAPRDYVEEFRVVKPDGGVRWIEVRGRAVIEDGVCVRFLGVAQDTTEKKVGYDNLARLNTELADQVEAALRHRERIFELSGDLFAATGPDGFLRVLNPAWRAVTGHDREALLSRRFVDLVHPDDQSALKDFLDSAEKRRAPLELRLLHADGSERWIAWTGAVEGETLYLVGRDVTADKQARAELDLAHQQVLDEVAERERVEETLRQLQRLEAVGQLTSGVAHDFNNLLTVIRGNIDFIERDLEGADAKLKRRLTSMRIAADRGATLTGQLLAFSRRQRLEPKPVDLNETVRGMRDLLQGTMGGSVRLETVLGQDLWPALVDPTQIELIILNLAINARDAMEVGGSLTVETANVTLTGKRKRLEEPDPGEYVVLSVNDTGAGMTPDVLQKAFEPFFTTKPVGRGSGLGLAQVYGFAKQSGGGVGIDTKPGEGTSVKVYLPRAKAAAIPDAASRQAEATPLAASESCVLLVDDDSAVREVTAAMLGDMGFEVCEAGSGRAALDELARRPDIRAMVVDYAMPGMSGAETAAEARRLYPNLPILFITGYADLAALKDVGEPRIVQKPFRHGELAAKLSALLEAVAAPGEDGEVVPFERRRR